VTDLVNWVAPDPAQDPLPEGWNDAAVAVVGQMADALGIPPLDMLAIFESESGLQPHLKPAGLAGLTPVVELEMGWPHGTIAQLIAGPVVDQLQGIFALWSHVQERYAGGSFAGKAKRWGVTPGVALYAYHGFLRGALSASGPGSHLADAATDYGQTYSGNPGLDIGRKGFISVGDLVARVAQKKTAILGSRQKAIYSRLQSLAESPSGTVPSLSDFFGSIRGAWRSLTGRDVRTSAAPTSGGASAAGEDGALLRGSAAYGTGGAPSLIPVVLLGGGVAALLFCWKLRRALGLPYTR
jgi:hypothetical protein